MQTMIVAMTCIFLITVLAVGILPPVFTSMADSQNSICVPNFLIPAYALTDNIFFTAPVGSDPTYDGGMRFNGDFGDNQNIFGFYIPDHASWVGKRLSEIKINLAIEGAVTGNLKIGVFQNNGPTYTVRSLFLTQDVTLLSTYPSWTNIVATGDYIIQSDDIIGIKADGVHTLDDVTGVHIQLNGDIAGFSAWDDNAHDGPITGIPNAVGELHELVSPSSTTPLSTQEGVNACNTTFNLWWIIAIVVIIIIIVSVLRLSGAWK